MAGSTAQLEAIAANTANGTAQYVDACSGIYGNCSAMRFVGE
jgi:hypothetical protein